MLLAKRNAKDERNVPVLDPRIIFRSAYEALSEYPSPRPDRRGFPIWGSKTPQNDGAFALEKIMFQNPALTRGAC